MVTLATVTNMAKPQKNLPLIQRVTIGTKDNAFFLTK